MSDSRGPISLDHFAENLAASVTRAAQSSSIFDRIIRYGGRIEVFIEVNNVPQAQTLSGAGRTSTPGG